MLMAIVNGLWTPLIILIVVAIIYTPHTSTSQNEVSSKSIDKQQQALTIYTNTQDAFSLKYPISWQYSENLPVKPSEEIVAFMGKDSDRDFQTVVLKKENTIYKDIEETRDVEVADFKCDPSLWQHIYNAERLKVVRNCISVTGTIEDIRAEADGDYHVLVRLDPQFANLVNAANNKEQNGDLVVEPVCQRAVTQEDAVTACANYSNRIEIPSIGTHVQVTGSYVLDTEHGSWAEIHPATSIVKIEQVNGTGNNQSVQSSNTTGRDNMQLSVFISVAKDPISRGNIQTVTISVEDASSHQKIKGASVSGTVTYASGGTRKAFGGTTDDNGQLAYSWRIGVTSRPGAFSISTETSVNGYQTSQRTDSFQVIPAS